MFSSLTTCGQERVGEASFDKSLQGNSGTLYTVTISVTPSHNLILLKCCSEDFLVLDVARLF